MIAPINSEILSLCSSITECQLCSFRASTIPPLAPRPVKTPVSIMFIGENPSWAEDQPEPFASNTISGAALEENYLKPLDLHRNDVWITDLFKCRYPKHIYRAKARYGQQIQAIAEICTQKWLVAEVILTQPKIIVPLSDKQVYQRLRKIFSLSTPRNFEQAVAKPHQVVIGKWETVLFPLAHPDVTRPTGNGDRRKINVRLKWASLHNTVHIPALNELLKRIE